MGIKSVAQLVGITYGKLTRRFDQVTVEVEQVLTRHIKCSYCLLRDHVNNHVLT